MRVRARESKLVKTCLFTRQLGCRRHFSEGNLDICRKLHKTNFLNPFLHDITSFAPFWHHSPLLSFKRLAGREECRSLEQSIKIDWVTTRRNEHNHGQYAHNQITSILVFAEQQAHSGWMTKIPGFCRLQHVPRWIGLWSCEGCNYKTTIFRGQTSVCQHAANVYIK